MTGDRWFIVYPGVMKDREQLEHPVLRKVGADADAAVLYYGSCATVECQVHRTDPHDES